MENALLPIHTQAYGSALSALHRTGHDGVSGNQHQGRCDHREIALSFISSDTAAETPLPCVRAGQGGAADREDRPSPLRANLPARGTQPLLACSLCICSFEPGMVQLVQTVPETGRFASATVWFPGLAKSSQGRASSGQQWHNCQPISPAEAPVHWMPVRRCGDSIPPASGMISAGVPGAGSHGSDDQDAEKRSSNSARGDAGSWLKSSNARMRSSRWNRFQYSTKRSHKNRTDEVITDAY